VDVGSGVPVPSGVGELVDVGAGVPVTMGVGSGVRVSTTGAGVGVAGGNVGAGRVAVAVGDGRGVGVAGSCYISGTNYPIYPNEMPQAAVQLKLDRSGRATVFCGASDIGQGSDSVLAYIVAEELGLDLGDIRVVAADTDAEAGRLFRRAAEKLLDRGAAVVVLACTEVPVGLSDADPWVAAHCLDPNEALAQACVDWALAARKGAGLV